MLVRQTPRDHRDLEEMNSVYGDGDGRSSKVINEELRITREGENESKTIKNTPALPRFSMILEYSNLWKNQNSLKNTHNAEQYHLFAYFMLL